MRVVVDVIVVGNGLVAALKAYLEETVFQVKRLFFHPHPVALPFFTLLS